MLDRLERERKLLQLDDVEKMLIPFCDTLRNMAERLGRSYGVEAMKMYIEAVEEAKQIVEEWMQNEPEPFDMLYQQQR